MPVAGSRTWSVMWMSRSPRSATATPAARSVGSRPAARSAAGMRLTPSSSDSDSIGAPRTTTPVCCGFFLNSDTTHPPRTPGLPQKEALDASGEVAGLLDAAVGSRPGGRREPRPRGSGARADAAAVRDEQGAAPSSATSRRQARTRRCCSTRLSPPGKRNVSGARGRGARCSRSRRAARRPSGAWQRAGLDVRSPPSRGAVAEERARTRPWRALRGRSERRHPARASGLGEARRSRGARGAAPRRLSGT